MKMPKIIMILVPVIVSLACLQPVNQVATEPTGTPMPTARAATLSVTPSPSAIPKRCAVISADEALRLRMDANPHARVLAFMTSGEVVKLISTANSDWWLIKRGNLTGYARSKYLHSSQCEEIQ